MSCIVEQLGLAMIPSCHARSSGLTCDTTSGTAGSMRQADRVVDDRRAALRRLGRERLRRVAAGAEQRDVDAFERLGRRELDLDLAAADGHAPARGPLGREQAQLRHRERASRAGPGSSSGRRRRWRRRRRRSGIRGWFRAWSDLLRLVVGHRRSIPAGLRPNRGVRSAYPLVADGCQAPAVELRRSPRATSTCDLHEGQRRRRAIAVAVPDERDPARRQVRGNDDDRGIGRRRRPAAGPGPCPRPAPPSPGRCRCPRIGTRSSAPRRCARMWSSTQRVLRHERNPISRCSPMSWMDGRPRVPARASRRL